MFCLQLRDRRITFFLRKRLHLQHRRSLLKAEMFQFDAFSTESKKKLLLSLCLSVCTKLSVTVLKLLMSSKFCLVQYLYITVVYDSLSGHPWMQVSGRHRTYEILTNLSAFSLRAAPADARSVCDSWHSVFLFFVYHLVLAFRQPSTKLCSNSFGQHGWKKNKPQ